MYIKVFSRGNGRIDHHLIHFFKPGIDEETEAYYLASDEMRKYVGARWAVSEPCHDACAALPVVCDTRSRDAIASHVKPRFAWKEILRTVLAKTVSQERVVMIELAENGYVVESYPGRWELTDAGKWAIGYVDGQRFTADLAPGMASAEAG